MDSNEDHNQPGRNGSSLPHNGENAPTLRAPHLPASTNGYPSGPNGQDTLAVGGVGRIPVYNTNGSAIPEDDDEPVFGNLLQIGWQRKWTILSCVVLGVLVGIIYLSRATPIYQSTAVVFMDQAQPKFLSDSYAGTLGTQPSMIAQAQVLTSTSMLNRAMELPSMKQADGVWESSNPLGYLRSNLSVAFGDSEEILMVSMQSPNAQDNAVVVNTLVQAYAEYHSDRRRNTAAEVLKVLQNEKLRLNGELDELGEQRIAFQKENGTAALRNAGGDSIFSGRLGRLADTLAEAELRTLNARLAYDAAIGVADDAEALRVVAAASDMDASSESDAAPPEARFIAQLELERYRLTEVSNLGSEHNLVAAIDAQIEALEALMQANGQEQNSSPGNYSEFFVRLLKQRLDSSVAAEAEYRKLYEAQEAESIAINSVYAEFANLKTRAERADRQLQIVDERIRELNLNDDYDVIDVSILEPAMAAAFPVSPQRSKTLAMALIMSLMLGCGLAFLQEMMDDRLRSGEEISSLLHMPILGVVPSMTEKAFAICGQIVDLKPQSTIAEAFRTVRTAIHFNPRGSDAQVVMITSPSPGDGKSTVASNLAIAMAQSGKRTLLVDADCRKPRQHRIFGLEAERGFSSLLNEKHVEGKRIESPIVKTSVRHLDLLPCGPLPSSPSEMLNSRRFNKLISQLREHYDHVIIDTPPTVPVSDSRIISASVDGYVLVLRAGKSGRKMAKHAAELLSSVGASPLGLVINGVTNAWGSYSYYSRYGYYQYGYGAYREEESLKPRKLGFGESVALPNIAPDEEEVKV